MKQKVQECLKKYYPFISKKQLVEMAKITIFHLIENAKTLAKKDVAK